MILGDVVMKALYMRVDYPDMRIGQSLFNALVEINSDLTLGITNTDKDPYHNDKNIDRFYEYIINNS